jgi:formate-dependent nitrite reductase membrane component NrfD
MTTRPIAIADHRFAFGYYRQVWWNWLIATAFFLGGIGSGLFIISFFTHQWLGMLVGYLVVVLGKNTAHLLYLGRPERFWRAAMRPDRSWIARGIWSSGLFAISGGAYLFFGMGASWTVMAGLSWATGGLAVVAALFITFYDGFVMNHSAAIPFWNSKLLPLVVLIYASLGGITLSLALRELLRISDETTQFLASAELSLLVANSLLLFFYLWRMSNWVPAARETVYSLLRGRYARPFLILVVFVGIVLTLLLCLYRERTSTTWLSIPMATCELIGDFTIMWLLLKSGLFAPQSAPTRC